MATVLRAERAIDQQAIRFTVRPCFAIWREQWGHLIWIWLVQDGLTTSSNADAAFGSSENSNAFVRMRSKRFLQFGKMIVIFHEVAQSKFGFNENARTIR